LSTFFKVREVRHMYCCNGIVVAVNATMTNDHYAK